MSTTALVLLFVPLASQVHLKSVPSITNAMQLVGTPATAPLILILLAAALHAVLAPGPDLAPPPGQLAARPYLSSRAKTHVDVLYA